MVQVVDVESESQSGMLSGTANGRATTTWEPRRCRGTVLEDCRTAPERATRRKDIGSVRRGRRRMFGFSGMCASTSAGKLQDKDNASEASGEGTASEMVVAGGG
jgi:hypothetical protein